MDYDERISELVGSEPTAYGYAWYPGLALTMPSTISSALLLRAGTSSGGTTTIERRSIDFIVNGQPLLRELVQFGGGHGDFVGSLVHGVAKTNAAVIDRLLLRGVPDTATGRVLLYVCPECGDIGCGAYAMRIERDEKGYRWFDFAYENGYEEAQLVENVGPFSFEVREYENAVVNAGAL